jgi:HD-like signal output (HDOD) protein/prolyl-tRNA editing enzyme YbaK/EbsC (Cys-tRNA(Pro) deacylase)
MALAQSVVRYLRRSGIAYDVMPVAPFGSVGEAARAAGLSLEAFAQCSLMTDHGGLVMVVIPASHTLDIDGLNALLGRTVTPATHWQVEKVFGDCDTRFLPALGEAYDVKTIIDEGLIVSDNEDIYAFGGDGSHLLHFSRQAFLNLQGKALFAQGLCRQPRQTGTMVRAEKQEQPPTDAGRVIEERLARMGTLPAMPGVAYEVFKLRAKPTASGQDLAKLVETDPSLTAQVIRYANSPFFAYRGKVDSVQTAISRVLGYEMVMHLALGIAAARPFKIPRHGRFGLLAFWRHAIYSATMMQVLSRELPRSVGIRAESAYLAGLLHNFGLLLVGHMFKDEYRDLCTAAAASPETPLVTLERTVLGIDHAELGAMLLETWGLPPEVIVTARAHHMMDYQGSHAAYAWLALVTDRMLMNHAIGDADDITLPAQIMTALGLDDVKVLGVMHRILEGCTGLDAMARQVAA